MRHKKFSKDLIEQPVPLEPDKKYSDDPVTKSKRLQDTYMHVAFWAAPVLPYQSSDDPV